MSKAVVVNEPRHLLVLSDHEGDLFSIRRDVGATGGAYFHVRTTGTFCAGDDDLILIDAFIRSCLYEGA